MNAGAKQKPFMGGNRLRPGVMSGGFTSRLPRQAGPQTLVKPPSSISRWPLISSAAGEAR